MKLSKARWLFFAALAPFAVGSAAAAPDLVVGEMTGPVVWASAPITAVSFGTSTCNIGSTFASVIESNSNHPILTQNLYRLHDGRFEQIGLGFCFHMFCALAQSTCGTCIAPQPGQPNPGCAVILSGCSSPDSSSILGQQPTLGRRSEVNASTGALIFPFTGRGQTGPGSTGKRLQSMQDDLNPAMNPGAAYIAETIVVSRDDAAAGAALNNASYRGLNVTVIPGSGNTSFSFSGPIVREQPAIYAWGQLQQGVRYDEADVPSDGRFILASSATSNGDGTWTYQYALFNLNSDRSARSFAVPFNGVSAITVFNDVDYHSGEVYDGTDWAVEFGGDAVEWSTATFAANPSANALRWGTLYNFTLTTNRSPRDGSAMVGLFKPGAGDSVTMAALVPVCPGDADRDGDVDFGDATIILAAFGTDYGFGNSGPGDADFNGVVNFGDLAITLAAFGGC